MSSEIKDSKETKDSKDSKETKDSNKTKDSSKETKDSSKEIKSDDKYYTAKPIPAEFDTSLSMIVTDDYPIALYRDLKFKIVNDRRVYQYTIYPKVFNTTQNLREYDHFVPNHWGQRKLFNSELLFLHQFDKPMNVIYVGSAPCVHLTLLDKIIFEKYKIRHTYHLYDSREFRLNKSKIKTDNLNYNIFHEYFTDKIAEKYKGKDNIVFISDIRRSPTEDMIMEDQEMQMNWVKIIKPVKSLLKFKLPYPEVGKPRYYEYLNGLIWLQTWSPVTSSETRLEVGKIEMKKYDIIKYEQQLSWFNSVQRLENLNYHTMNDFTIIDNTYVKFDKIKSSADLREIVDILPPKSYVNVNLIFELYILSLYYGTNINTLLDKVNEITEIITEKNNTNLFQNLSVRNQSQEIE